MKENQKLVGKVMTHPVYGQARVDSAHGNTRTKVDITCIDRGAGWCPIKEKYVGVKHKGGWSRRENYAFGEKDVVHIKQLRKC